MAIHADWPFVVIHWEPVVQTVWLQWRTPARGEPFQSAFKVGLDLLEQRQARNWLSDMRHVGVLGHSERAFINQEWLPRAHRSGLRNMALVTPRTSVPALTVNAVMEGNSALISCETGVTMAYFQSVEAALLWLRRQGSPLSSRDSGPHSQGRPASKP